MLSEENEKREKRFKKRQLEDAEKELDWVREENEWLKKNMKRVVEEEKKGKEVIIALRKRLSVALEDSELLEALRAEGVDNWEGYGEAVRSLEGEREEERSVKSKR